MARRRTRSKRRTRKRRQYGGSSCSARPSNYSSFNITQRGGVAPFNTSGPLLTSTMQGWAGDSGQIAAIQESQLLAQQAGGRRSRRRSHSLRRHHHRSSHRNRNRKQRGGNQLADYKASYDLGFHSNGTSSQYLTEPSVNPNFGFKGAQA